MLSAMVASSTRPFSCPACRMSSITSRRPLCACDDNSISTNQGSLPASGMRLAASNLTTASTPDAQHQLERGDAAGGAIGGQVEQVDRGLRRRHAGKSSLDRARPRHQAQHRRGDDAERAFGADEKVLEVVAGIVLLQLVEIVQHAAVGQHDFEAQRMRARNAVGDRRGAAGIGREIAADGAAAFRRQQLRIEPVDFGRRFARTLQRDAGFDRHGVGDRIDLADLVEPGERQHDLAVERDLPADQPGVAALRHDGGLGLVGELEDRGHFVDRARPQHHRRVAVVEVAHLDQIGLLHLRIGDRVFLRRRWR